MARRFLVVTVCLVATVSFLVGLIVAGSTMPAPAQSAPPSVRGSALRATATPTTGPMTNSFADIAEQLNPAGVNIDATTGDILRRLTFDPTLGYQPRHKPMSPNPTRGFGPCRCLATSHTVSEGGLEPPRP